MPGKTNYAAQKNARVAHRSLKGTLPLATIRLTAMPLVTCDLRQTLGHRSATYVQAWPSAVSTGGRPALTDVRRLDSCDLWPLGLPLCGPGPPDLPFAQVLLQPTRTTR